MFSFITAHLVASAFIVVLLAESSVFLSSACQVDVNGDGTLTVEASKDHGGRSEKTLGCLEVILNPYARWW